VCRGEGGQGEADQEAASQEIQDEGTADPTRCAAFRLSYFFLLTRVRYDFRLLNDCAKLPTSLFDVKEFDFPAIYLALACLCWWWILSASIFN
jgi:hypothetical protein